MTEQVGADPAASGGLSPAPGAHVHSSRLGGRRRGAPPSHLTLVARSLVDPVLAAEEGIDSAGTGAALQMASSEGAAWGAAGGAVSGDDEDDISIAELDARLAAGGVVMQLATTAVPATVANGHRVTAGGSPRPGSSHTTLGVQRARPSMGGARCQSPLDLSRAVQAALATAAANRLSPGAAGGAAMRSQRSPAPPGAVAGAAQPPASTPEGRDGGRAGSARTPGSGPMRFQLPDPCPVKDMKGAAHMQPQARAPAAEATLTCPGLHGQQPAAAPASQLVQVRSISRLNPAHPANVPAAVSNQPQQAPVPKPVVPCAELSPSALTPGAGAAAAVAARLAAVSGESGSNTAQRVIRRRIDMGDAGPGCPLDHAAAAAAPAADGPGAGSARGVAAAAAVAATPAHARRATPLLEPAAMPALALLPDTPDTTSSLTIAQLAARADAAAARPAFQPSTAGGAVPGSAAMEVDAQPAESRPSAAPAVGVVPAAVLEEVAGAVVQLSAGEEETGAASPSSGQLQQPLRQPAAAPLILERAAAVPVGERRDRLAAGSGLPAGRSACRGRGRGWGRGRGRQSDAIAATTDAAAAAAVTPAAKAVASDDGDGSSAESSPDVPIGQLVATDQAAKARLPPLQGAAANLRRRATAVAAAAAIREQARAEAAGSPVCEEVVSATVAAESPEPSPDLPIGQLAAAAAAEAAAAAPSAAVIQEVAMAGAGMKAAFDAAADAIGANALRLTADAATAAHSESERQDAIDPDARTSRKRKQRSPSPLLSSPAPASNPAGPAAGPASQHGGQSLHPQPGPACASTPMAAPTPSATSQPGTTPTPASGTSSAQRVPLSAVWKRQRVARPPPPAVLFANQRGSTRSRLAQPTLSAAPAATTAAAAPGAEAGGGTAPTFQAASVQEASSAETQDGQRPREQPQQEEAHQQQEQQGAEEAQPADALERVAEAGPVPMEQDEGVAPTSPQLAACPGEAAIAPTEDTAATASALNDLPLPAQPKVQLGAQWKRGRVPTAPPPAVLLAGRRGPFMLPSHAHGAAAVDLQPQPRASQELRQELPLPAAPVSPDGVCQLLLKAPAGDDGVKGADSAFKRPPQPRPSPARPPPGAGQPSILLSPPRPSLGAGTPAVLGKPPRSPGDVRMSPSPRCGAAAASPSPPSARAASTPFSSGAGHRLRDPSLHPAAVTTSGAAGSGRAASVSPPQPMCASPHRPPLAPVVSAPVRSPLGLLSPALAAMVAAPAAAPAAEWATSAATCSAAAAPNNNGLCFLSQPLAPIRTRPVGVQSPPSRAGTTAAVAAEAEDDTTLGVRPGIVRAVEALLAIPRVTADDDDDESPMNADSPQARHQEQQGNPTAGSTDKAVPVGASAAVDTAAASDKASDEPPSEGPKLLRSALHGVQPFFSVPGAGGCGGAAGAASSSAAAAAPSGSGAAEGTAAAGAGGAAAGVRPLSSSPSWPLAASVTGGASLVCDERLDAGGARAAASPLSGGAGGSGKAASPLPPRPKPTGKPPTPTDNRSASPVGGRPGRPCMCCLGLCTVLQDIR